jgi:tRNA-2-methylthio-N6-dimethylallyladenosine synthase
LYSKRPGIDEENMFDLTTRKIKKKRLLFLQDLIKRNVLVINKEMIGTVQRVLIVGFLFLSKNIAFGYTDNNRLICFKIPFLSENTVIVNVCITCTQATLFFGFCVDGDT